MEDCGCPSTAIAGHYDTCPLFTPGSPEASTGKAIDHADKPGRIPPHRRLEVCRHLATEDVSRADLARQFGVTKAAITLFARRHRGQIDEIRAQLDDEFTGLWIADQRNRLAAYQADYELAAEHDKAGHHEWIKARAQLLHAVAEETGQLPGCGMAVIVQVVHVLAGVDVGAPK